MFVLAIAISLCDCLTMDYPLIFRFVVIHKMASKGKDCKLGKQQVRLVNGQFSIASQTCCVDPVTLYLVEVSESLRGLAKHIQRQGKSSQSGLELFLVSAWPAWIVRAAICQQQHIHQTNKVAGEKKELLLLWPTSHKVVHHIAKTIPGVH